MKEFILKPLDKMTAFFPALREENPFGIYFGELEDEAHQGTKSRGTHSLHPGDPH